MPGTSQNLKRKDLATDFTALASVNVNIKVPESSNYQRFAGQLSGAFMYASPIFI
jgi:hypothetical protein